MKSILIISLLFLFGATQAQVISLDKMELNQEGFSSLEFEGTPPKKGYKKVLKITNLGKENLLITEATGGCHCTKVRLKKKRLKPNQSTKLIIKWNPSTDAEFSSSISIKSNAKNYKEIWLQLLGNVEN